MWQCKSMVTESDANPIPCKLEYELCKQLLSPVRKGHHSGVGVLTDSQRAAAAGN